MALRVMLRRCASLAPMLCSRHSLLLGRTATRRFSSAGSAREGNGPMYHLSPYHAWVTLVPMFADNYAYLITEKPLRKDGPRHRYERGGVMLVDCADAERTLQVLDHLSIPLDKVTGVLCTHHHWDHVGGNEELRDYLPPNTPFIGGDERIPALNTLVHDNHLLPVADLLVRSISTPCHTSGHYSFVVSNSWAVDDRPALFCGDTLFLGGCGRFFEGTARDMTYALLDAYGSLHDATAVYCGHEYSVSNLKFACAVDPDCAAAWEKLAWAEEQRSRGEPTVPSTLGEEREYNPFMRAADHRLAQLLGIPRGDPVAVMQELRERKNKA